MRNQFTDILPGTLSTDKISYHINKRHIDTQYWYAVLIRCMYLFNMVVPGERVRPVADNEKEKLGVFPCVSGLNLMTGSFIQIPLGEYGIMTVGEWFP